MGPVSSATYQLPISTLSGAYRRSGRLEAGRKNKNSEFGIQTNSHNPLFFNKEQEKVRILNSGNGFADR